VPQPEVYHPDIGRRGEPPRHQSPSSSSWCSLNSGSLKFS